MDVAITRISSKGQIVIPSSMRKDLSKGEEILIIKNKDQIILKKVRDLDKLFKEDLLFAKRTEEALKKYNEGKFKELSVKEFVEELEKW